MSGYWQGRKVLVTGGSGFIGSHVVRALVRQGAHVRASCTSVDKCYRLADLQDRVEIVAADLCEPHDAERVCRGQDAVISLAHSDGSLAFKRSRPAYLFRRNMLITLNLLDAAAQQGIKRFLLTSSSEIYPLDAPVPTAEHQTFFGPADRPNDGYVWSKRMSELATTLFAHEYGITVVVARPSNIYGPDDDFEPARGRVISSFIRQALADEPIVIWGDGGQIRSFLYVEDLAAGILALAEKGRQGDAVNFAGEEISIGDLASLVVRLCGSSSVIRFEPDKPAGPRNRSFDSTIAAHLLGFHPSVPLETGLVRTIAALRSTATPQVAAAAD